MAQPPAGYRKLLAFVHDRRTGDDSDEGARMTERTRTERRTAGGDIFRVRMSRGDNTWRIVYQRAPGRGRGRILRVIDEDGRVWFAAHDGDRTQSWTDGGVR